MKDGWRYALEMYDRTGASLGVEPVEVDFSAAEEWTRLQALRTGALPPSSPGAQAEVVPIWSAARGQPFIDGFRVRLQVGRGGSEDHRGEVASEFGTLYFGDLAQEASSRLLAKALLAPGDTYRYVVTAFPQDGREERDAGRFTMEEIIPPFPLVEADLDEHLLSAAPQGPAVEDDIPVFIPRRVLTEAAEQSSLAGNVETGGILVGHLHRDPSVPEVFAVVTAQIPASGARGERTSLSFTPETWTEVRSVLALRRRNETMLGWFHSHPVHAWCANCPIDNRRRCALSTGFFSTHDRALHRTIFPRAYGLALVVNDIGAGERTWSLFGWRHGLLQERGYHVIEAAGTGGPDRGSHQEARRGA